MITIPMHSKGAIERSSLSSLHVSRSAGVFTAQNITSFNKGKNVSSQPHAAGSPPPPGTRHQQTVPAARPIVAKPIPVLTKSVQKGQKTAIFPGNFFTNIKACFGWNITNSNCDVDVSAFLLNGSGKVIGDSWFVFYGQTDSPDQAVQFKDTAPNDREMIQINLTKLDPAVKKIVFVLTINDAFKNNLNFSMIKDAYIRIMNAADNTELVSFKMTEYYSNVISMMIGEIYQHNGTWKFSAVGNGVARDLAGLCDLYGVQVIN